jgi:hypothetical protein
LGGALRWPMSICGRCRLAAMTARRAEGLVEVEGHKGMLRLAPRRLSDRLIYRSLRWRARRTASFRRLASSFR